LSYTAVLDQKVRHLTYRDDPSRVLLPKVRQAQQENLKETI